MTRVIARDVRAHRSFYVRGHYSSQRDSSMVKKLKEAYFYPLRYWKEESLCSKHRIQIFTICPCSLRLSVVGGGSHDDEPQRTPPAAAGGDRSASPARSITQRSHEQPACHPRAIGNLLSRLDLPGRQGHPCPQR